MSEKKILKRAVKAAWDRVKLLRAERGKLYASNDIMGSADSLGACANQLRELAKQLSSLSAMPPDVSPKSGDKPKRKRKTKVANPEQAD